MLTAGHGSCELFNCARRRGRPLRKSCMCFALHLLCFSAHSYFFSDSIFCCRTQICSVALSSFSPFLTVTLTWHRVFCTLLLISPFLCFTSTLQCIFCVSLLISALFDFVPSPGKASSRYCCLSCAFVICCMACGKLRTRHARCTF